MTSPILVFDLDGTLVDTAPDLVDTLNVVLAQEKFPPLPYDVARNLVGGGAKMMIRRGLETEGQPPAEDKVEHMLGTFIDYYAAHIADRSAVFPGVEAALDRFTAQGFRLAVCTNKLHGLAVSLLDRLNLSHRFAVICGQDTYGTQKPDPIVLRRTIADAGGDETRAVMIGDSVTDIRTARAAGVPVVAVDFGYSDPPVIEYAPDRLISHFDQLADAVHAVLPAK
jgi:phosphoglycolate phosphatase